jgi:acyl-CoA thioesterase
LPWGDRRGFEVSLDAAAHPFDADTKLAPIGDNRFSVTISDRWNTVGGRAFGGYGLAICLRALGRDMRLHDPLVVSAFFLRAVRPGPAEVRTEHVSAGRRVGFAEAQLMQEGKEALRVIAAFTDLSRAAGPTLMLSERPALPPPTECFDLGGDSPTGRAPVSDRVECRVPALPGWRRGQPTGNPSATFWMRFREPRDVDLYALPLLVDAAAPAVFELAETGSVTIELTVHLRAHPAPGWLSCRALTRHVIGGYHEEDFEIWDAEGKLVAQSRQLALLPSRLIRGSEAPGDDVVLDL